MKFEECSLPEASQIAARTSEFVHAPGVSIPYSSRRSVCLVLAYGRMKRGSTAKRIEAANLLRSSRKLEDYRRSQVAVSGSRLLSGSFRLVYRSGRYLHGRKVRDGRQAITWVLTQCLSARPLLHQCHSAEVLRARIRMPCSSRQIDEAATPPARLALREGPWLAE